MPKSGVQTQLVIDHSSETTTGSAKLGMAVGLAFYQFSVVEAVGRPYMTALNSLPRIALAPLVVLWFGFGSVSRSALAVSLVFFIAAINTYAGLGSCDRDFLILARSLGAGRLALFWKFVLPSAIPTIFAGLQIGLIASTLMRAIEHYLLRWRVIELRGVNRQQAA